MASLAPLTVIETATGVAGPYCGRLLAAFGADVVKVEPPDGDESRQAGPFPGDMPDPECSGTFLYLNSGKRSVVPDGDDGARRAMVAGLAARADLVIDDGHLDDLGIELSELWARNPRLVVVRLHGMIPDTAEASWAVDDTVIYAASAWMAAMGRPGEPPVHPGQDYPAYVAALYAFFGAMGALLHGRRTGQGQAVDISMLESAISVGFYDTTGLSYGMPLRRRAGNRLNGVAASVQPCGQGWVAMTVSADDPWRRLCEVLDAPELAEGEFATSRQRMVNSDDLEGPLQEKLAQWSSFDVAARAQERHVAVSPVLNVADLYGCDQLRSREWFVDIPHPTVGRVTAPGLPFRLSATTATSSAAPRLGEHTREVVEVLDNEVAR